MSEVGVFCGLEFVSRDTPFGRGWEWPERFSDIRAFIMPRNKDDGFNWECTIHEFERKAIGRGATEDDAVRNALWHRLDLARLSAALDEATARERADGRIPGWDQ